MTKKELIAALANVNDDAVVLFGTKEIQFFGAFATQVYINWDSNEVLIANKHTDATLSTSSSNVQLPFIYNLYLMFRIQFFTFNLSSLV